ncbi:hypothetical protein BLA39750_01150 [Burkholderia lata]|uniref:Uncharacterized protein n=1 Tax=Burkholderia lata (strain ATCC 17760 / DSM 23089 / LMG 22485 / NCIMB 9086 / R18194 / 383) TaxID=482957 RepID=A0A6P2VFJ9_BURL3|nr:hypothetical protein [Burkholderia lata]VWC80343.1 hypothetical protein BLA39750_01150 [Burkholderia lata]
MNRIVQSEPESTEKPNWFLAMVRECVGERSYDHRVLIQACGSPDEVLRAVAECYYDEDGGEGSGNGFFHCNGEVFVSPGKITAISDATAKELVPTFTVFRDDAAINWKPSRLADPKKAEQQWRNVCNGQGWNEASRIAHLEEYLRGAGLFEGLASYAKQAAEVENGGVGQ